MEECNELSKQDLINTPIKSQQRKYETSNIKPIVKKVSETPNQVNERKLKGIDVEHATSPDGPNVK